MFTHVNFLFADGHVETISPLKYAFKVLDTYMCKIFFRDVPQVSRSLYLTQTREQKEHLNLDPLFKAYDQYAIDIWWRNRENRNNTEQLDIFLRSTLGKLQRNLLPAHFIKELSRTKLREREQPTFNDPKPPLDCKIFYNQTRLSTIVPFSFHYEVGIDAALVRDDKSYDGLIYTSNTPRFSHTFELDNWTLQDLYKVRFADLNKLIHFLEFEVSAERHLRSRAKNTPEGPLLKS